MSFKDHTTTEKVVIFLASLGCSILTVLILGGIFAPALLVLKNLGN